MDFQPGTTPGEEISQGGKTWIWDGEKWNLQSAQGGGGSGGFLTFSPPLSETANNVSFVWSSMSSLNP